MRGSFITFEGGEGSGKSTQMKRLCQSFEKAGIPFIATREPGGVESAERIRELLVSGSADAWRPVTETLLFTAARVEHVDRLIKPALEAGTHVICDRFADSTAVYQGIGKGLSENFIQMLHRLTLGNMKPDLTLLLDINPSEGLKRASARKGNETRFEALPRDFHRRVRAGFLSLAAREPRRFAIIEAGLGEDDVHQNIVATLSQRLGIEVA